jgi:hydrogenase expression/formation protein HypC
MCLAVPAQIRSIEGATGQLALSGNRIEADLSLVEDPAVGDWVLVHAGFAIEKLDPEEARETLDLFASMEGLGASGDA